MQRTVAEWLKELKVLDSRILTGITKLVAVGVKIGSKIPTGFANVEEFNRNALGSLESVEQLIVNRDKIKSAIVKSNAVTPVVVAGVAMTVAEAIEKKSSIGYLKTLTAQLERQFATGIASVDKGNAEVKARLDQMLTASRGKEGKADPDADASFSKTFTDNNQYTLLDPAGLRERIEKLHKTISDFEASVDTQLSISNATTSIDVD